MITDAALPAAPHLLGEDASQLLQAAMAPSGDRVLTARSSQVAYRPGRSLLVRYAAEVERRDGSRTVDTIMALTTAGDLPDNVVPLEAGELRVGVWRYPFDPALPGLPSATSGRRVRELLDRLEGPPGPVALRTRAYRPQRRAVVQATVHGHDLPRTVLFLKVLPPDRAARVHATHLALDEAGVAVPRSVGLAAEQGIVALTAVPGVTLRDALCDGLPVPEPAELCDLQQRLARAPLDTAARPAAMIEVSRHAELLTATLRGEAGRVAELAERCAPGDRDGSPPVTVHGDLYDAQVLVVEGAITGLIDLDGAGPGYLADDAATLIGHLETLALVRPQAADRIRSYAAEMFEACAAVIDRAVLARLVAAVCLGLATGAFRVQEPGWEDETRRRLDLAASWSDGNGPWGP
jgi:hypothetical protein